MVCGSTKSRSQPCYKSLLGVFRYGFLPNLLTRSVLIRIKLVTCNRVRREPENKRRPLQCPPTADPEDGPQLFYYKGTTKSHILNDR